MKTRRVNRYSCDFCKKSNCSAASISKHESRCTLNPNRVCGMCKMLEQEQPTMQVLLDSLPDRSSLLKPNFDFDNFEQMTAEETKKLSEAAGGCPACMMAALRQKKIPVAIAEGFDFTKECKSIWADVNEANYDRSEHY